MEGEAGEFHDWEVLANSSDSDENTRDLVGIESDSGGMIRSDYFSLDSMGKYARRTVPEGDLSEEGDVESDNPSWIDPESMEQYPTKERGEFWSDSSSDRSDDRKFNDLDAKNELGFLESGKNELGLEGIGETGAANKNPEKFWSDSSRIGSNQIEFGETEKDNEMGIGDYANSQEGSSEVLVEEKAEEVVSETIKSGGEEEEKRTVVWWKVPMELLKFCVFRVSPVWTFSVAAAVMGLVMLGRRLYKMKRKSRNLQLKVTLDDKKVSQFMRRAARLNEAFSVVKRVPVIRPSHPAAGVTPWPVMSLR